MKFPIISLGRSWSFQQDSNGPYDDQIMGRGSRRSKSTLSQWEDVVPGQRPSRIQIQLQSVVSTVFYLDPFLAVRLTVQYDRPRSYRLHFQKWGITKATQLENLKAYSATSIGRRGAEPVDNIDQQEGDYGRTNSERSHSLPPESRHLDASTETLQRTTQSWQASGLSSSLRAFSSARSITQLESVYVEFRNATESRRFQILEETDLADGQDNVIHYAATRDDAWTLSSILECVASKPVISQPPLIDHVSSGRRTALEIAIQVGKAVVVETLLKAGASVQRRNDDKQQPLHFAISHLASADICRVLINFGAKPDAPFLLGNVAIPPINMVLERFLDSKTGRERDILCATLQELVDHGARISSNGTGVESSLMKFVKASTELDSTSLSSRQKPIRPSSLLGYYLSADRNPLCWFPKQYCPALECKSLAAFVFAHTPKSGLSAILIESSDMMHYGLDLVCVLLTPCRMRYSADGDPSVNKLLETLLQRMKSEGVTGPLKSGLLDYVVQNTPEKKRLERLEILLTSRYVSADECRQALTRLDEHEEPFQLAFAELLLSQSSLPPDTSGAYQEFMNYFFNQKSSRMQDFTDDRHARERFKNDALSELRISPPTLESGDCIVDCVVHVFTKAMLQGEKARNIASAERIIYMASRLREQYQLPDIPVAKHLLLELHYFTQQQNKHLRGVLGSDTSDSADSPETVSSDGSAYSHSPRIENVRRNRTSGKIYSTPDSL